MCQDTAATACYELSRRSRRNLSLPEQIYLREAYEPGENRQLLIGGEAAHSGATGSQQPARAESQDSGDADLLRQLMARIDEHGETMRRMELRRQKPERAPPVAGVG